MTFWVVSPNVRGKASDWKQIMSREHVAIMGWGPNRRIGKRFIRKIQAKDVILIARRHHGKAEVVGLGVVRGPAEPGSVRGKFKRFLNPTRFGSLRNLSPFVRVVGVPESIPFIKVLGHTMALVKLHPERNLIHTQVCRWMDDLFSNGNGKLSLSPESKVAQYAGEDVHLVNPPKNRDFDYRFRSKSTIVGARKSEAELLEVYRDWIQQKHGYVPRAIKITKANK